LVKGADVLVQNGVLSIEFDNVIQNAKVYAIEILPVASGLSGPPLLLNFKYPHGTPVAGTLAYTVSSSLLSFQGTATLNNGQAQAMILANPSSLGISAQFRSEPQPHRHRRPSPLAIQRRNESGPSEYPCGVEFRPQCRRPKNVTT
jgi:hypothetical protein